MNKNFINDMAEKLAAAVPGDISDFRLDLEKNFQAVITSTLDKMDLVTREEFDVQTKVLARTRQKLDHLEQELEGLQRDASS